METGFTLLGLEFCGLCLGVRPLGSTLGDQGLR